MKTRSAFLTVFLMAFASQSFAGSVEIAQWIPWNFISSEIQKIPLQFSSGQEAINLPIQDWKPKFSGAQYQIQGGVSEIKFDQNGVQALSNNLSARLKIGEMSIDQTIVKEFAGNQVQIHVQATCQPFEIQISNFTMTAQAPFVRQNNAWSPALSQVSLQIPQGSWSMTPLSCQGLQGLDQKIVAQIQEALNHPEVFQNTLKAWIAPRLDEIWQSTWNSLKQQAWQNLKIDSMAEPTEKGFYLLGHLETKGNVNVMLPSQLDAPIQDGLQLFLTTDGFSALAQDNLSGYSVENYNLQNISGFSSLMHNRFLQFFVWPDLLHFSRDIPVLLSTLPDQNKMTLKPQSTGNWQLTLQTRGVIRVERKGQMRNYINFGIGMASNLTTDVKDSHLLLKTSKSNSNLRWAFDPTYIQLFNPSTRISSAVLDQASKSLFQERSMDVALPVLNWKDKTYKLNGWKQQGSMISMEWK